jgi:hypothetical protein
MFSDIKSKARLDVLKKLRSGAAKKIPIGVEVEADSKEGLKKGLDLAKNVVDKKPEGLGADENQLTDSPEIADVESEVSPEAEVEGEEQSPEAKIEELEAKLASLEERLSKLGV